MIALQTKKNTNFETLPRLQSIYVRFNGNDEYVACCSTLNTVPINRDRKTGGDGLSEIKKERKKVRGRERPRLENSNHKYC